MELHVYKPEISQLQMTVSMLSFDIPEKNISGIKLMEN